MASIKPVSYTIDDIIKEIKNGQVKIPRFQRQFVWSKEASAELMDSVIKGYPIGTFIYWKTKDKLRIVRNVGNLQLPDTPNDDYIYYVLDGQQRITSIFASAIGEKIENEDYSELYLNLKANEDEEVVVTDATELKANEFVSLKDIIDAQSHYSVLVGKYSQEMIKKIFEYHDRLIKYDFSVIELTEADLSVATEIFTRINTSGKSLSIFEIMCAKMYNEQRDFDLYEKRDTQRNAWESVGYETIPDATVLQVMSACICKSCKGSDILALRQEEFIPEWDKVSSALDSTIDYFKKSYGVPVSNLLPYDALIVLFAYYFYNHTERPTGKQQQSLQDYFWRCIFGLRFTEGAASKINSDIINVMDKILRNESPVYDWGINISTESIKRNGVFSLSSAYVKGIVCILCNLHPLSFIDGHEVTIDNAWLSQGNSKNYHHFFPKAYMKKNQPLIDENLVNHVVNITIVDSWLNKSQIKANAPSEYMKKFQDGMPDKTMLDENMKSHLITDLDDYGIWKDDYNLFFEKRLSAIHDVMVDNIDVKDLDEI